MTYALQSLTPAALAALSGAALEDARKVTGAVHRDAFDYAPRAGVRRETRAWLVEHTTLPALDILERHASAIDPFVKLALAGKDGRAFEAVRIPLEKPGRYSVCVSSQVGCALACAFCATGRLGLQRNLEPWEIVEQVRIIKRTLAPGERIHGVVFQGMGEPMANLDRVLQAIEVMRDPAALQIDARNITVCTSGLPDGILRLARQAPKVRLGISLASARPDLRQTLMPIEKAHPLDTVLDAAAEHAALTGLAPMWAVTLLEGVNDTAADAHALLEKAQRFLARTGLRPRLSIIAYNRISADDDPFYRTSEARERAFRETLHAAGFATHRRYSGGADVAAACGQLGKSRRTSDSS